MCNIIDMPKYLKSLTSIFFSLQMESKYHECQVCLTNQQPSWMCLIFSLINNYAVKNKVVHSYITLFTDTLYYISGCCSSGFFLNLKGQNYQIWKNIDTLYYKQEIYGWIIFQSICWIKTLTWKDVTNKWT